MAKFKRDRLRLDRSRGKKLLYETRRYLYFSSVWADVSGLKKCDRKENLGQLMWEHQLLL